MIAGIGVDIVEISRIKEMRLKHGEAFFMKCFTENEVAYCLRKKNADESLAARFAAKEAVMKALGTGWGKGVAFNNIEVVRDDENPPRIVLHGAADSARREKGIGKILLSLSHSRDYALAEAIALKDSSEIV